MLNILRVILCFCSLMYLSGCDNNENIDAAPKNKNNTLTENQNESAQEKHYPKTYENVLTQNIQSLEKAARSAEKLGNAVTLLLSEPNEENLNHAQKNWYETESLYSKFISVPIMATLKSQTIDNFNAQLTQLHAQISARPIQPGFLDSFADYPYSGIVHDVSMPISKKFLIEQNQMTSDEDVALGLYAIEYILFNENRSRKYTDFIPTLSLNDDQIAQGFKSINETPQNRRRTLLRVQTNMLADDINKILGLHSSDGTKAILLNTTPKEEAISVTFALREVLAKLMVDVIKLAESKNAQKPDHEKQYIVNRIEALKNTLSLLPFEKKTEILNILGNPTLVNIKKDEPSLHQEWEKSLIDSFLKVEPLIVF